MKKLNSYVYRHVRHDTNEVFYVGVGTGLNYKRSRSNRGRNIIWKSIVAKTSFSIEILYEGLSFEKACDKEKEFILLYGRKDIKTGTLANMTFGGEGMLGYVATDEAKRKTADRMRSRVVSPETRAKLSRAFKGKKQNPEDVKKRFANRGPIVFTEEVREKLRASRARQIEKGIAVFKKGNNNPRSRKSCEIPVVAFQA